MSVRRHTPIFLVCCGLTVYFAFHAVEGKHGLKARTALTERSLALSADLGKLTAERDRLAHEVALLSKASADTDYVEELARGVLGYARPTDRVLLEPTGRIASVR